MNLTRALGFLAAAAISASAETPSVRTLGGAEFRHDRSPSGLAFVDEGRQLVSMDTRVHAWEVATGRELRSAPGGSGIRPLKDGRSFAILADPPFVWDALSGEQRALTTPTELNLCDVSADETSLLVWTKDWSLGVVAGKDDESPRLLPRRPTKHGNTSYGAYGAFSPDGNGLAVWDHDEVVRLYDVGSLREYAALDPHADRVDSARWSPDGHTVATLSSDWNDASLDLWDDRGKRTLSLPICRGGDFQFSPDGRRIAWEHVWQESVELVLTDLRTGEVIRQFPLAAGLSSLTFSPDGARLAFGTGSSIRFLDLATGSERSATAGHTAAIRSLDWSNDGRELLTASEDRTARVWDVRTLAEKRRWTASQGITAQWSPEGRRVLLTGGSGFLAVYPDPGEKPTWSRDDAGESRTAWSADGKRIIFAADVEHLRFADAATGQDAGGIPVPDEKDEQKLRFFSSGCDLAASPDGRYALVAWAMEGMNPGSVDYGEWSLEEKRYRKLGSYTRGPAPTFAWSADSRLAALAWDYFTEIRRPGSDEVLLSLATPREQIRYMGSWLGTTPQALSPDGRYYAVVWSCGWTETSSVHLYDLVANAEVTLPTPVPAGVTTLAWSPDGLHLAVGCSNGLVLLITGRPDFTPDPDVPFDDLWERLASPDPREAWLARWAIASRDDADAVLARLEAAWKLEEVASTVLALDADEPAVRDAAAKKLADRGGVTPDELRALEGKLGVEARSKLVEIDRTAADMLDLPSDRLLPRLRAVDALGCCDSESAARALAAVRDRSPWKHEREVASRILAARGPAKR